MTKAASLHISAAIANAVIKGVFVNAYRTGDAAVQTVRGV